jgi:hypothetical protein
VTEDRETAPMLALAPASPYVPDHSEKGDVGYLLYFFAPQNNCALGGSRSQRAVRFTPQDSSARHRRPLWVSHRRTAFSRTRRYLSSEDEVKTQRYQSKYSGQPSARRDRPWHPTIGWAPSLLMVGFARGRASMPAETTAKDDSLRDQFGRQIAGLAEPHKRHQRPRHLPNHAVEDALRDEEHEQQ